MAWELTRWLVLTRAIALMGVFVSAAMNGYLTGHIYFNKLGLTESMVSIEFVLCIILLYNTIALVLTRSKKVGAKRTKRLTVFVVGDVMFIGAILAVVSILSRTGVPGNCSGLTNGDEIFSERRPGPDFTTLGFSDQSRNARGELDKLCSLEKGVFFISIGLVYSFILTIVLGILVRHTKDSKLYQGVDARDSAFVLIDKLENSPIELNTVSHRVPPPVPPSEGVTSPRTSVRAPVRSQQNPHFVTQPIPPSTPSWSSTTQPMDAHSVSVNNPRPFSRAPSTVLEQHTEAHEILDQQPVKKLQTAGNARPLSSQGAGPISPLSPDTPAPLMPGIVSDNSQEHMAAAAMVTDGSQGYGGSYQPGMATLPPYSPSSPTLATRTNAFGGPDAPASPPRRSEKT